MFEPGTHQRPVYFHFDLRFSISIMFGHVLTEATLYRKEPRIYLVLVKERDSGNPTRMSLQSPRFKHGMNVIFELSTLSATAVTQYIAKRLARSVGNKRKRQLHDNKAGHERAGQASRTLDSHTMVYMHESVWGGTLFEVFVVSVTYLMQALPGCGIRCTYRR